MCAATRTIPPRSLQRPSAPKKAIPMASVLFTPRQLAPTVGLAAALAGFHPDGTFYIDSGTRHLPARGRPRAPLPRVLFSSLPRLWSCKLRAIASLRQDASVSPATSASSPSTSVRAHARSTRNTAEVLPLDRLSLLRVAARAGMALMRRPAALPCGRAQLVPPRLLPGWLASSRRPARSPSLVGPVSPILHPDQLHPDFYLAPIGMFPTSLHQHCNVSIYPVGFCIARVGSPSSTRGLPGTGTEVSPGPSRLGPGTGMLVCC